jgi:hypothetical protein
MMKKTKLAKAIIYITTGGAIAICQISSAAASGVNYNTTNAYTSNKVSGGIGTDGWTTPDEWTAGTLPFGTSASVVNWAAEITSGGDSLTVSSQNSHDLYGIWADIDTAKGGWFDGTTGWGHNTDVGLFKSDIDTEVTIYATAIQLPNSTETWSNFGISIFSGMSANTWDHHGQWNCPTCSMTAPPYGFTTPFDQDNPLGSIGLTYVTRDASVDATNGITFHAEAGQIYSVLLGGNSGSSNFGPYAGYSLNITTSPVPLPASLWLFVSGLAGLFGIKRRKQIV